MQYSRVPLAAAAVATLTFTTIAAPVAAQRPAREPVPRMERVPAPGDSAIECTCQRWASPEEKAERVRVMARLRSKLSDSLRESAELSRRLTMEALADLDERGVRPAVSLFSDQPGARVAIVRALSQARMEPGRAVLGLTIGATASVDGLEVAAVTADGPAARAGILPGDRLTAVDGTTLMVAATDSGDAVMGGAVARRLTRRLDSATAGDTITLRVSGDNHTERVVRVATVRADALMPEREIGMPLARMGRMLELGGGAAPLGVRTRATGTARDTLGVFVMAVVPGSAADRAGVHEGMRVSAVNGEDLRVNPADVGDRAVAAARADKLQRALASVATGESVILRVREGSDAREVTVTP